MKVAQFLGIHKDFVARKTLAITLRAILFEWIF